MSDHFDGDGFDKSPIEGQDAAKVRHMLHSLEQHWPTLSSVGTVVSAIGVVSTIIKIGGPVLIGAAILGTSLRLGGWI